MTPLTPADIAEIRARVEAATDGPWLGGSYYDDTAPDNLRFDISRDPDGLPIAERMSEPNVIFIAAARSDLPRLLDAYEELQAETDRLYEEVFWISEYPNREHIIQDDAVELAEHARKALSAEDSA